MNQLYQQDSELTSNEVDRNIYKTARVSAGLTQERAAELLSLSVESLRAYETGRRIPANDTVSEMIDIYGHQVLAVQHLRATSGLARSIVPDAQMVPLPQATLRVVRLVLNFMRKHRVDDLMDIAEDGIIDETERPQFDEIMAELEELSAAVLSLQMQ